MKRSNPLKIFSSFVGLAVVLATTQSIGKTSSVEQVISQYQVHLNASDTQAIMALYGKTPIFMPQHSTARVGRGAVEKAYESVFANIDLDINFTTYEIEINGDTAWARTSSAGKTTILANGAVVNEGNNELFVFKMEHGDWKIHRYLFSTTTPRKQ